MACKRDASHEFGGVALSLWTLLSRAAFTRDASPAAPNTRLLSPRPSRALSYDERRVRLGLSRARVNSGGSGACRLGTRTGAFTRCHGAGFEPSFWFGVSFHRPLSRATVGTC